jgi:hypothetical protein
MNKRCAGFVVEFLGLISIRVPIYFNYMKMHSGVSSGCFGVNLLHVLWFWQEKQPCPGWNTNKRRQNLSLFMPRRHIGGVELWLQSSLTSLDEDESSASRLGRLTPGGKRVRCPLNRYCFIHPFSSLPYARSNAPSKANSPHSAIYSFLLHMTISSPFLKVIQ